MNERILELAKQAGLKFPSEEALSPVEIKFAELIVRECLVVINQSNGVSDDDVIKISQDVKKHFGIEELHTCPYREEIYNDYESLCDCDEEQQHQCAMDI